MIACMSVSFGLIAVLLAPLGICYLFTMYDVVLLICDKHKSFYSAITRNVIVIGICTVYFALAGTSDPTIIKYCGIPIMVSVCVIGSLYLKKNEPAR